MEIKIKNTGDGMSLRLNGLKKDLAKVPDEALVKFRSLTPIRTGNARRSTKLRNRTTIDLAYDYAQDLDNGKSKQAPNGMTKPFAVWLKNRVETLLRKGP